jgi:hypothetical protein
MMRTAITTVALGAALLLTGSWGAGAQEGLFTSERDCTTDVQSLCAGVKPGVGAFSPVCSPMSANSPWAVKWTLFLGPGVKLENGRSV